MRLSDYTSEVPGVTTCPECDVDLEPVESEGEPPVQSVVQMCPECHYNTPIGMVWYTTTKYEVIGDVDGDVSGDCDRCDGDALYSVIGAGLGVSIYYCEECLPAHSKKAVSESEEKWD